MNEVLTIEECAEQLKVSRKWIYETAIPHLGFPARRLGQRNLRVDVEELNEWWRKLPACEPE